MVQRLIIDRYLMNTEENEQKGEMQEQKDDVKIEMKVKMTRL